MSKQGFIQLHRKIQDHWLYQEKRTFSKFEAWIDMLMMANHKDNKFLLGNELVEVKRGEFITSIRKLEERWKWSNTKVKSFLNLLQSDEMITYKSDTKKTVITIDKYSNYHDNDNQKTSQKHHDNDTNTLRKHTNNNDNNVNNDKKYSRKQVYDETSNYYQLAIFFYQQIKKNNPNHKEPNFQTWSDDIRKMIELDNRTEEQVKYLMRWVQEDDFEMANVLSPSKLRKRFDQLVIKVKKSKERKKPKTIDWEAL